MVKRKRERLSQVMVEQLKTIPVVKVGKIIKIILMIQTEVSREGSGVYNTWEVVQMLSEEISSTHRRWTEVGW